jgi:penicillin-binding protein 1A
MRRLLFVAGLVCMALIAAAVAKVADTPLPEPQLLQQTSLICTADVGSGCTTQNAFAKLNDTENREIVSYDKIPKVLIQAVVDSEDRYFFDHKGIDPVSISRALYWDLRSGTAVQGGSTITQQYVKNTFLTQEQTVTRKLKEAIMAIKVEQSYSKEQILEGYLNTIYFGRNAYGIQAATQAYFGKDVSKTTKLEEVAYLAGLIRSPNKADATEKPKAAEYQRHKVLDSMLEAGDITQEQYKLVDAMDFKYVKPKAKTHSATIKLADKGGGYITSTVETALRKHADAYGLEPSDVALGGLRVYTSIDPNLQAAAWDAMYNPAVNKEHLNDPSLPVGALVSIDDHGNIKAMVGGREDGSGFNFATQAGRGVGSTFKAIVLAEALEENYSLQSTVAAPDRADIPPLNDECPDPWHPRNAEKEGATGQIDLLSATEHSVNTAYANLTYELAKANGNRTDKIVGMAKKLGMDTAIKPCIPLVLGSGSETNAQEMAEVYSTFANGGVHKTPHLITKIEKVDQEGNAAVVYEAQPEEKRVISQSVARRVNYALEKVIEGGTGRSANIGKPAAGKTGTVTDNKDAWFVGYTPKLTTAVWMGFPNKEEQNPRCIEAANTPNRDDVDPSDQLYWDQYHGHPEKCPKELPRMGTKDGGRPVYGYSQIFGGTIPAAIWKIYMLKATEGKNDPFDEPTQEELRMGDPLPGSSYFDPDGTTTTVGGQFPGNTTTTRGHGGGPPFTGTTTTNPSTTSTTTNPDNTSTTSTTCIPKPQPGGGCRGG